MFWLDRYGCWEYKSHCCCVNTALEWSIIEYRAYLRSPKWTTESVSKDLKDSVTQQQVPEEERTRPSECVIAQETTHGSSSFNLGLQMKLMENRYIFCRDVGWWAESRVSCCRSYQRIKLSSSIPRWQENHHLHTNHQDLSLKLLYPSRNANTNAWYGGTVFYKSLFWWLNLPKKREK